MNKIKWLIIVSFVFYYVGAAYGEQKQVYPGDAQALFYMASDCVWKNSEVRLLNSGSICKNEDGTGDVCSGNIICNIGVLGTEVEIENVLCKKGGDQACIPFDCLRNESSFSFFMSTEGDNGRRKISPRSIKSAQ